MSSKALTRSFAGGEITPELFGRIDLSKFQTGLKNCRNFEILPHGPAANRTGFEYVLETKFSAQVSALIPFIYNTTQTYMLEIGNLYIRFHTDAGTLCEAAQSITSVSIATVAVFTKTAHGYLTGNWIFLSSIVGMANLTGRFMIVQQIDANTFSLTDLAGVAFNSSTLSAFVSGNMARVYEVVTPYLASDLYDAQGALWLHFTQSSDVLTFAHPSYQTRELKRISTTNWTLTVVTVVPTQGPPTAPAATATGAGAVTYTYAVTALASNTLEESVQTADASCTNDLTIAGHTNKVTWTNVAGAVRYNVYKVISGLYGYIGQGADGTAGFVDNNITPTVALTPPIANDPITGANKYPGAVGYYQGRRWFAGSNNAPQGLYATRSGTESNMQYSVPSQANDSISVRLTARQNNTIRHIVPLSDLLLLTSGGEWKITSSGVITPLDISYTPEDYIGSSNAAPITTASAILFSQARGARIREMKFQWQQQGYRASDISIMAPHLFDSYTITSMAYAQAPYSIAWMPRSDGTLLGLTYVQEQGISAWHHHDTAGSFECASVVPEDAEDALYAIVNRTVNGRTVRYVERMRTRNFGTLANCFFVDAGATYSGAPATTISGLYHLEGATVAILADGAVVPQATVVNGSIKLATAASLVSIGLPYIADLETLPMAIEGEMAFAQGAYKNINQVFLRVNNTSGAWAGPSPDQLTRIPTRTNEPYGSPPRLISGVQQITISPDWNYDGGVCVRQTDPLPVTVLSMVLETALGG